MKQTRRSRRATRQRKRILMISGVVLAAILIVFVGVYLGLRHSVNKIRRKQPLRRSWKNTELLQLVWKLRK